MNRICCEIAVSVFVSVSAEQGPLAYIRSRLNSFEKVTFQSEIFRFCAEKLELLTGFEPVTSSLPSVNEASSISQVSQSKTYSLCAILSVPFNFVNLAENSKIMVYSNR